MIKEAIATGENVEAAFANACRQLGVDTTDASCDVLELPQKKTLGLFGGRPAKVRAYIEIPDPVKPAPPAPKPEVKPMEKKEQPAPAKQLVEEKPQPKPKAADGQEREPVQKAADYVKTILSYMGLPGANVDIQPNESGAALVLSGDDVGFVIGHRGETLDALQYLASLVANHTDGSYFRLTLDVGNYREKRKETLESLGRKMAHRAVKTGRNASLEPMNPYERRIIHTAVQEVEGAKSWSEGADQARHVVIGPEGGERYQSRNNNRRGRGGYNGNRGGFDRRNGGRPQRNQQRSSAAPRAEGPKADDPNAPIYGKIEAKK